MVEKAQLDARLTQYLLGGGSQSERERLEAEYFADEDAFARMLNAEDDLIDAYARGELSADDRLLFENKFLSTPEGCDRIQFARTLAGVVSEAEMIEPPTPAPGFIASLLAGGAGLRYAAVALVVLLVGSVSWLVIDRTRTQKKMNALQIENERTRNEEVAQHVGSPQVLPSPSPRPSPPNDVVPGDNVPNNNRAPSSEATVSLALFAGNVRGGDGGNRNTLRVSNQTKFVMLRVMSDTDTSYAKYHAEIATPEGEAVWNAKSFASDVKNGIKLPRINARVLRPADYILILRGEQADGTVEPVGQYSFRVVNKPSKP